MARENPRVLLKKSAMFLFLDDDFIAYIYPSSHGPPSEVRKILVSEVDHDTYYKCVHSK